MVSLLSLSYALTAQEALSGIFGSISLATWIFLLVRHTLVQFQTLDAHPKYKAFVAWNREWLAILTGIDPAGTTTYLELSISECGWCIIGFLDGLVSW